MILISSLHVSAGCQGSEDSSGDSASEDFVAVTKEMLVIDAVAPGQPSEGGRHLTRRHAFLLPMNRVEVGDTACGCVPRLMFEPSYALEDPEGITGIVATKLEREVASGEVIDRRVQAKVVGGRDIWTAVVACLCEGVEGPVEFVGSAEVRIDANRPEASEHNTKLVEEWIRNSGVQGAVREE